MSLPYPLTGRHGAARQRPQSCQVIVRKNRATLSCGEVRVEFIARGDLEKMPVATINTPLGVLRYATPEVTALELVGYPKHAGGLSNVAAIVGEQAKSFTPLRRAAAIASAKRSAKWKLIINAEVEPDA